MCQRGLISGHIAFQLISGLKPGAIRDDEVQKFVQIRQVQTFQSVFNVLIM